MVVLSENVGVKRVKKLYAQFKEELESNDILEVDFSEVHRVDLSIIQLIIVTSRYAKKKGKTMKLKSVGFENIKRSFLEEV